MKSDATAGSGRSWMGIILLGVTLGAVQVRHAFELNEPLQLGIGVVVPMAFAIGLVACGIAVRQWNIHPVVSRRMVMWAVIGAGWMAVVATGAIAYQLLGAGVVRRPLFYASAFVTYGTLPGILVGWYDGRQMVERQHVEEKEASVSEANEQLKLVLEAGNLGFWDWNVQTDEVTFGGNYASIIDSSPDELGDSPKSWEERIHPDDLPEVNRKIREHFEGESEFYRTTHRKRTGSGEWKWIRDVGKVVEWDDEEEPLRAIGINEDITLLKERERELEELKERLDLAVEGANLGVWDWDMQTDEVERDERWTGMLGYEPGEIESKIEGFEEIVHPDDKEVNDRALEQHVAGEEEFYECEYRLRTRSGEWKWIRNIGKVFDRDNEGNPIRSVGIHQDIDEQKRTYEMLEQKSDQLEALIRVVRHDIRNEMNVVHGWAEHLESHVDESGRDALEKVLSVSEHVIELTNIAREYVETLGGEDHLELQALDLLDLLETEVETHRDSYADVSFSFNSPDSRPRVMANEMLSSVFRNILTNAVQHNTASDPHVWIDVSTRDDVVEVEIADNGPGIPDDRKETVFGRGEKGLESSGTGIGLYLVDTLVESYDGEVTISDNEPTGSVFTIRLPTAE